MSDKFKGLGLFTKSAKSLGFGFKQGKGKSKQKDFAKCVAESKSQFAPVLFIAQPLYGI